MLSNYAKFDSLQYTILYFQWQEWLSIDSHQQRTFRKCFVVWKCCCTSIECGLHTHNIHHVCMHVTKDDLIFVIWFSADNNSAQFHLKCLFCYTMWSRARSTRIHGCLSVTQTFSLPKMPICVYGNGRQILSTANVFVCVFVFVFVFVFVYA